MAELVDRIGYVQIDTISVVERAHHHILAARLPGWAGHVQRLGANEYDAYRVNHTLRVFFALPFMKRSSAVALVRYESACRKAENRLPSADLKEARRWQTTKPHAGGLRLLSGIVARTMLAEGRPDRSLPLYERAQRQVPDYTSWYLEYVYFALACREKIHGAPGEADRENAARAIVQGRFLLDHGMYSTGLAERYTGRLHQLRFEWAEAVPYLLAARMRLTDEDRVACDQARVPSCTKTGRKAQAIELLEEGTGRGGRFSDVYRSLKQAILTPVANPRGGEDPRGVSRQPP